MIQLNSCEIQLLVLLTRPRHLANPFFLHPAQRWSGVMPLSVIQQHLMITGLIRREVGPTVTRCRAVLLSRLVGHCEKALRRSAGWKAAVTEPPIAN